MIKFRKDEFLQRVMEDGKLKDVKDAERVVYGVFNTLKGQISEGRRCGWGHELIRSAPKETEILLYVGVSRLENKPFLLEKESVCKWETQRVSHF